MIRRIADRAVGEAGAGNTELNTVSDHNVNITESGMTSLPECSSICSLNFYLWVQVSPNFSCDIDPEI